MRQKSRFVGMPVLRALAALLAALAMLGPVCASESGKAYDAILPAQLTTDSDLCAYAPCAEVMPGADSFSPRKGRPPYVEAWRTASGKRDLVGYVFLSTDIVDIPGYSGQPIVTLIGMDTHGTIAGVKVLRHAEPILLLGIPETALTRFMHQYVGKFVGSRMEIGKAHVDQGYIGLDAISGATVTVVSENQAILRSAMEIAKQVGILQPTLRPQARFLPAAGPLDWKQLVADGGVQRLTVQPEEVGSQPGGQPFIDMYFGDLNAPAVGRSILGDSGYQSLLGTLQPGDHAIFVIANGMESFKGSGFVRGGIFDRIQVAQDMDTFTFRDLDYRNLYNVHAAGAPAYRESGIFIIRGASFSDAYPWSLVFLANRKDKETGAKSFVSFDSEYWLPARYLDGGRPAYERPARSWPFVTFWGLLFAAALFIERPFCKYLCPLGAGLAIPSTFRWWGLKRKQECGPCTACGKGCESQAIDSAGRIDPRECLLCLDCMVMYYDDKSCPPLVKERKARTVAGLPMTPIGANGYYIPIQPVPATRPPPAAEPPPPRPLGVLAWLRVELVDHLLPWNRQFLQHPVFFRAAGIGLAVLVTWAWLLGAAGKLGPGIILGWWLAWSAYEMVTRMIYKPRVKEGPWWGRSMRAANWADMAAYVSMKNLIIGAGLFLAMKGVGVLQMLHGLPELRWLY
jgi:transcriptional regulator of nitric oxide reductase